MLHFSSFSSFTPPPNKHIHIFSDLFHSVVDIRLTNSDLHSFIKAQIQGFWLSIKELYPRQSFLLCATNLESHCVSPVKREAPLSELLFVFKARTPRPLISMKSYTPIAEHKQEGDKNTNLYEEYSSSSPTGCEPCGCLKFSCFNWAQAHEVHSRSLLEQKESWLVIKIKIMKNLVKKIGVHYNLKKSNRAQFQYDAQSYALNFDDGARGEEDGLLCNFSSRFAVPVTSQKRDGLL